ncbi:hypothetical protein FHS20_004113 [Phyllobacterium endophyticum]|nr:hypothetical protein [Phyllobacterium endophyticum]
MGDASDTPLAILVGDQGRLEDKSVSFGDVVDNQQ